MNDMIVQIRDACQFAATDLEELRQEGERDWGTTGNTIFALFAVVLERAEHTQNAVRGLVLLCRALALEEVHDD